MTACDNPLLTITDFVDYAAVRPEHVTPAVTALAEDVEKTLLQVLDASRPATWENVVEPLNESLGRLTRAWGVVGHLQSVCDTPELRDAYNRELPRVSELLLRISLDTRLYERYKALHASDEFSTLSPVRQRILERDLRDFRLSGADLPDDKRARVQEIGERLSLLSQKFSENLLDATNAFTLDIEREEDLDGVPEDVKALYRATAEAAGKKGWRVTLQFPSYLPFMQFAKNRALREKLYHAFSVRASELDGGQWDNGPLMKEILALRDEEAKLLGFANYAESSLAVKMASTPKEVTDFLRDLARHAKPFAVKDMEALREHAKSLGLEKMESWDQAYVSESLRKTRYSYSSDVVKRYFTESTVFAGLFHLAETLYGIRVEEREGNTWHPDVKFFALTEDGKDIAYLYADLHARAGKRSGAWMDSDRARRMTKNGLELPIAYLVCNFAPGVDGREATLTHDDVTTLFHEFGHALHHMLTAQTEEAVSGINGVEWDAVELPSQFMENFAWDERVVTSLTKHVETGEKLPHELFAKMLAAKNFEAGMQTVRQIEFALFDMLLHSEFDAKKDDIADLLARVRDEVAVSFPPSYNRFANSFSHIFAGGYAAGYYSYKWAEVLSADAFGAFEETGVLNADTGRRFREEILSRGSSRDAMDNFVAFRGRKPTVDALLRQNGMIEEVKA